MVVLTTCYPACLAQDLNMIRIYVPSRRALARKAG